MLATVKHREEQYHYTESGLDDVYLIGGFDIANGQLHIDDIEGLHRVIGEILIKHRKNLSGKEIKFLRVEMLMSQSTLAALLGVSDRAVIRWEKAAAGQLPSTAEASIRMLYRDFIEDGKSGAMRKMLRQIAATENEGRRMELSKTGREKWRPALSAEERQLSLAAM
jgi:putative transcriptional regulator